MKHPLNRSLFFLAFIVFSFSQIAAQQSTDSPHLQSITSNYWKEFLGMNPLTATGAGVLTYNDQLEITIGRTYINQSKALATRYLDSANRLQAKRLTPKDQLVLKIFQFSLKRDLEGIAINLSNGRPIYRPVDQFVFSFLTAFASLGSGTGAVPFKTVKDYDDWLKRQKTFAQWVDTAIMRMNEGIRLGNTNPKASMLKVPQQLKPLFDLPADSSIFYKPITSIPVAFSEEEKKRLTNEYRKSIDEVIRPAYKRMHDYLVGTYIPAARNSSGLLDNAGGKEEYRYFINYWATSPMDPEKIFDLGIREVARIRKEMDSVRIVTGFKSDLPAFFEYVKTDPKFFPFATQEEVLERFGSFKAKLQPAISRMFDLLPKADFEIRATEKFREVGANAQYKRGAPDGSRKGVFYEVIPEAKKYNASYMETLFLHEAIPGHHFQVALQQEMEAPEFMKSAFFGAFSEGWGLYAETLGKEMGMYTDPYQYLGRLNADMERSVRLVVDVGLHYKGWTREKAIGYILENQPLTRDIAEQRIERYMVVPAQALSYKIGEQKILELRKLAQERLGSKFRIQDFHNQVLKDGAMPLSILDAKIRTWIDAQIKGGK
ncbi:MAG: DUF885 domain-containing protein [Gemmatimonadaceae bacterium]|nr:DUF885 domain-containing protein [Chitinophagaceae bacterium]